MSSNALNIRLFERSDQAEVRALILDGLRGHFGDGFDASFNADLDDIGSSYAGARVLVAVSRGRIAGTGTLVLEAGDSARIVRMSTDAAQRRSGIGTAILNALTSHARRCGVSRIVLSTNESWTDAIGFYQAFGFREIARAGGGVRFALDLQPQATPSIADSSTTQS